MKIALVNPRLLLLVIISSSTLSVCNALANNSSSSQISSQLSSKNKATNPMKKLHDSPIKLSTFERQIAAKLALDFRYYCPDGANNSTNRCVKPLTKLPSELSHMITKSGIGSIVLFAENLIDTPQIIELTHDLQKAASKSESGQPLILSIDQEGGRVARLPQATSFAGNMAIGATYTDHSTYFATETSTVIAKELTLLGFNNNYAPVVDVNTNPDNPVINTRSYGEDPQRVAELGAAAVNAFQQQGIMATLKHFPGHGDTHVDSHLGLPLVEHDLETIVKKDLVPFEWAIKQSDPAMIMTAHIQYPALDNSLIENISGDKTIRPATMSRKILTDLLRKKMGFKGIIATDALDMAGIAHYFDEVTAVVETFIAGADLAVMPFRVRERADIDKFYMFIQAVAAALKEKANNKKFSLTEITASVERLNTYKAKYIQLPTTTVAEQIAIAQQQIAQPQYLALEQSLADNAVNFLSNGKGDLPINTDKIKRIHVFVLNWEEFRAMKAAITQHWQNRNGETPLVSATVITEGNAQTQVINGDKLAKADLIIATIDTKIASVVDIGGAEDVDSQAYLKSKQSKVSYQQILLSQLTQANNKKVPSVLIVKGSPFLLKPFRQLVDNIIITFDDRIYLKTNDTVYSPGYQTSIAILSGKQKIMGKLPVRLLKN